MHPFEQQVRERAYFIWEGEGRVFGHATEHWLRAEHELSAETPIRVRPVTAEISLAPSPARALKPKAGARSAAAEAVAATGETAKPVKVTATKTAKAASAKPAPTKAAAKTLAPKTLAPKTLAAKAPAAKASTAKASTAKTSTPRAASRSKAFEAGVVMH